MLNKSILKKQEQEKNLLADPMSLLHSDKNSSMLLVQEQIEQPHKIEHSADPGTSIYANMELQINEKRSCKLFKKVVWGK